MASTAGNWEKLYPGSVASGPSASSHSANDNRNAANIPTTNLELSISCRGLRDLDVATKSDPQCFVYMKDSYQDRFYEIGRTEQVRDSLNPDFVKKIIVNFNFELVQKIKFELWDIDPVGKEFLGQMETTIADIVAFKGRQFIKPLIGKNRNLNCGQIIIVVEEVAANKQMLTFSLLGCDIRRSFLAKRDTFAQIWKSNEDGMDTLVHKTEVVYSSRNPKFKPISIRISTLCNGDMDRNLRIDLMEYSFYGSHRLLGSINTTVKTMVRGSTDDNIYIITKKSSKEKKRGRIAIKDVSLDEEVTFLDFIRGGTELHFAVAIDFTASNGNPYHPSSLHFVHSQKPNPYEIALRSIGEIIAHYDPKNMFASFGFGAIVGSDKVVSHHFPLNGNSAHPYVHGITDLLACYRSTLSRVVLYGPTHFAPVIDATAEIAKQHQDGLNYFILLLITDGIVLDMTQCKKAIVRASQLPLSIIIVGVGNADFSAMNELDSDDSLLSVDGKKACRDIVQFVPMNRFLGSGGNWVHSMVDLAKEVLYEVPEQITSYMKLKGFQPRPPKDSGPTAPSFNYNFN